MNFRKATEALTKGVTLEDLAKALGVSLQGIRQARAAEGTTAFRSPPSGWEAAVAKLAAAEARKMNKLAQNLIGTS